MTIRDKDLSDLSYRKHNLIRSFERKEMSEAEYNQKYSALQTEINERVRQLVDEQKVEAVAKEKEAEENKMSDEKVEQPKKPGKQPSENSYTGLIIKGLKMKSLKDADAVVEKVNEWKPGREIKKIKTQTMTIISLVKKQTPARWQKYSWNEEEFLLIEKEE